MTEKRFTVPVKYRFSHSKIQLNGEPLTNDELILILNANDGAFVENFSLKQENEWLKQELKTKCIVNKQYEENQRLIKMLDNVANYMQKQHKDMQIDDFVEWWNNMATEGLE